jgi:hypothetical protein
MLRHEPHDESLPRKNQPCANDILEHHARGGDRLLNSLIRFLVTPRIEPTELGS